MPERPSEIDVVANLRAVRAEIEHGAALAGRDPRSIELLAVAKGHRAERIRPALAAGHRAFGENRVQEAAAKWPALREAYPGLRLHLIGPLQTNKARDAVALFDAIETLDRPHLAAILAREMDRLGRRPELFVEVNIAGEPQKAGIAPAEAPAFVAQCREEWKLPVVGLMCIPPEGDDPAPHFLSLAALAASLGLRRLSMGMSGDFKKAIAAGATEVRVGTAIFGPRAARDAVNAASS